MSASFGTSLPGPKSRHRFNLVQSAFLPCACTALSSTIHVPLTAIFHKHGPTLWEVQETSHHEQHARYSHETPPSPTPPRPAHLLVVEAGRSQDPERLFGGEEGACCGNLTKKSLFKKGQLRSSFVIARSIRQSSSAIDEIQQNRIKY